MVTLFLLITIPIKGNAQDSQLNAKQIRIYEQEKANQERSEKLLQKAQTLNGRKVGTCVLALRQHFEVAKEEVNGYARTTKINSQTGEIGAVIVFKNLSKYGHVGIILADKGDKWLYFHSNVDFKGTAKIEEINKQDPSITGYRILSN